MTFEQYMQQHQYEELTIKTYARAVELFVKTESDSEPYKYQDILNYMNKKAIEYPTSDLKNVILASIKKYYDYLIEIGKRQNHPCRNLFLKSAGINKHSPVLLHELFSSKELELLLNREVRNKNLKIRNQVIASLFIYQGLTAGEVTRLKLSNIDLDKGTIFIKESRKNTRRILELVPRQFRMINSYIDGEREKMFHKEIDAFLVSQSGITMAKDDIHYLISTFKSLFPDRNLHPRTIRQSVIANWLNEKKLPLEQVQLMAGHRWISSTLRYRSNNTEEQREIINRFHPLG
jgi:integrase/recombinase XerD